MPTVTRIDPDNPREIKLSLPAKYFGKQTDNLDDAIEELQTYLKDRYPEVGQVCLLQRNPPRDMAFLLLTPTEIWILIALSNNPLTNRLAQDIADDAYKWVKKKFSKKQHRKKRRKPRR